MMPFQSPILVTWLNGHRTYVLWRGRGAVPGASGACRGHTASGPPPDAFPPLFLLLGMIKSGMVVRRAIKVDKRATQHH